MITKVLGIIGTRPEAIKMAPLFQLMRQDSQNFELEICGTAQHRELLDQVLSYFNLELQYDLDVMSQKNGLTKTFARMLEKLDLVIQTTKPNLVLVHGDTSTTFSGALAAFYQGVSVAHVEAGLRSKDLREPFPEEFNRRTVSSIAQIHFAPTEENVNNLLEEGIPKASIFRVGNTVVDALRLLSERFDSDLEFVNSVSNSVSTTLGFEPESTQYILVTIHRRENRGERMDKLLSSVITVANEYPDVKIVIPVHPNPAVRTVIKSRLSELSNVTLIDPQSYPHFIYILKHSRVVMTDSGGIQEEAPSFGVPVLVLREVTERRELIESGTSRLVGTNPSDVLQGLNQLMALEPRSLSNFHENPFGDGLASLRILETLRLIANS